MLPSPLRRRRYPSRRLRLVSAASPSSSSPPPQQRLSRARRSVRAGRPELPVPAAPAGSTLKIHSCSFLQWGIWTGQHDRTGSLGRLRSKCNGLVPGSSVSRSGMMTTCHSSLRSAWSFPTSSARSSSTGDSAWSFRRRSSPGPHARGGGAPREACASCSTRKRRSCRSHRTGFRRPAVIAWRWRSSATRRGRRPSLRGLVAAGGRGHKEPWDAFWGQRYAEVLDPDGNVVDLFAPLRLNPSRTRTRQWPPNSLSPPGVPPVRRRELGSPAYGGNIQNPLQLRARRLRRGDPRRCPPVRPQDQRLHQAVAGERRGVRPGSRRRRGRLRAAARRAGHQRAAQGPRGRGGRRSAASERYA